MLNTHNRFATIYWPKPRFRLCVWKFITLSTMQKFLLYNVDVSHRFHLFFIPIAFWVFLAVVIQRCKVFQWTPIEPSFILWLGSNPTLNFQFFGFHERPYCWRCTRPNGLTGQNLDVFFCIFRRMSEKLQLTGTVVLRDETCLSSKLWRSLVDWW